ncbi:MAG: ABC transporter ATP-binding protein [Calditrichia bacterium]
MKAEKLTKRFGDFTAVDQVSIEVYEKEIFGFLGANGAGKTTLIRMLCGLLLPSEGSANVAGYDVYRQNEQIKKSIGYMSQKFSLYEDLTLSENIKFYGGIYGLSAREINNQEEKIITQFGLQAFRKTMTRELPLGFRQRLALGCALLHNPGIVFLDEPTSGVDPRARREFWDLIYETADSGKTVFVTTHFMDEAEYCHRVSIMQQGKIVAVDSPVNLQKKYRKRNMQEVFVSLMKALEEQP